MFNAEDAALIAFGLIAAFAGYSVFRDMLPLWGFVLGGWITYILLPTFAGAERASNLVFELVAVVIGGIIGAAISIPLYFVIIFLSGAALGMLLGIMAGALVDAGGVGSVGALRNFANLSFPPFPQTGTQFVLMILFGLIMGGLAFSFQKFMISASSAFIGSAALITGLGGPITQVSSSDMGKAAIMMMSWMLLGFAGLIIQFRMSGEV